MIVTILDGPVGTELAAQGVATPLPGWSAHAVDEHPNAIREIHAAYARAGATVHTACTFRTIKRAMGDGLGGEWGEWGDWERLARDAVRLAREGAEAGTPRGAAPPLIAGSIAPLADCYRPDLSPANTDSDATRSEHAALASVLANAGADMLLVETFPHIGELIIAVEEAARATHRADRAIPVWASLTPGYLCDLLTPSELAAGAAQAIEAGASAVLVNCVPAALALDYVQALADVAHGSPNGIPFGVYANAGKAEDKMGWTTDPIAADRYADLAQTWIDAGATIVGGCCGTGPAHIAELARRFGGNPN